MVFTHVPFARELRETVSKHAIAGTLTDVTASWPGAAPELKTLTLKTKFQALASAAQPAAPQEGETIKRAIGLPGFENLSGSIDMADGAGSMQLASRNTTLILPGVFAEPRVTLAKLGASVRWKSDPALEVRVSRSPLRTLTSSWKRREFTARPRVNEAGPAGSISQAASCGYTRRPRTDTYHSPPAAAQLVATRVGFRTRNGRHDARQGDLSRFPFEGERDAEFRIAARVVDAALDVHPAVVQGERSAEAARAWPLLKDIDADLLFDRASMTVTAKRGAAYSAKLSNVVARIPELGPNAKLDVHGVAEGPLADMVRYVNTSPVSRWIGGITANAEASGNAKLDLRLGIPLGHASDSKVTGALQFANNDVQLADVPSFSRVNGTLNFTRRACETPA